MPNELERRAAVSGMEAICAGHKLTLQQMVGLLAIVVRNPDLQPLLTEALHGRH